jgi:hypothetical protein
MRVGKHRAVTAVDAGRQRLVSLDQLRDLKVACSVKSRHRSTACCRAIRLYALRLPRVKRANSSLPDRWA